MNHLNDTNPKEVLTHILSYFSEETEERYEEIALNLSEHEEKIKAILSSLQALSFYRSNKSKLREISKELKNTEEKRNLIKLITEECKSDELCSLIKTGIAFESSKSFKAKEKKPCPELVNPDNDLVIIKNTIILIVNKEYKNDPNTLLEKIGNQIVDSPQSFNQLLGLEMQNLIRKRCAFLDSNLLDISKEALLFHRNKLEKNKIPFDVFIRDMLIEQIKLNLREDSLSILEKGFLDEIIGEISIKVTERDIALINTFYNGSKLHDNRLLNFGDIFKDRMGKYYLCVTALCDCVIFSDDKGKSKSNINYRYYFVKGNKITLATGFGKGDGGFISYIDEKICISWTDGEYIKPFQLYIPNPKIKDNLINYQDWDDDGQSSNPELEYVFTLKQSYAQRIANQAFSHPVRVGVDFAKVE